MTNRTLAWAAGVFGVSLHVAIFTWGVRALGEKQRGQLSAAPTPVAVEKPPGRAVNRPVVRAKPKPAALPIAVPAYFKKVSSFDLTAAYAFDRGYADWMYEKKSLAVTGVADLIYQEDGRWRMNFRRENQLVVVCDFLPQTAPLPPESMGKAVTVLVGANGCRWSSNRGGIYLTGCYILNGGVP